MPVGRFAVGRQALTTSIKIQKKHKQAQTIRKKKHGPPNFKQLQQTSTKHKTTNNTKTTKTNEKTQHEKTNNSKNNKTFKKSINKTSTKTPT